jgi:hypothetical protein
MPRDRVTPSRTRNEARTDLIRPTYLRRRSGGAQSCLHPRGRDVSSKGHRSVRRRQPCGGARTASLRRPDRGEAGSQRAGAAESAGGPRTGGVNPSYPGATRGQRPSTCGRVTGRKTGSRRRPPHEWETTTRFGYDRVVRRANSPAGVAVFRATSGALPCPGTCWTSTRARRPAASASLRVRHVPDQAALRVSAAARASGDRRR